MIDAEAERYLRLAEHIERLDAAQREALPAVARVAAAAQNMSAALDTMQRFREAADRKP